METQKLILPQQVRPQRVDITQVKADTEPKQSIFDNPEFLAELRKGPEQAFKALRDLKPNQLKEFLQSANPNKKIDPQVMRGLVRDLQTDLARPDSQKDFKSQYLQFEGKPTEAKLKLQEIFESLENTNSTKPVVEKVPVVGKVRLAPNADSSRRELAEVLANAA